MERCTYFEGGKWRIRLGDTEYSGLWVDRLAAYEDAIPFDDLPRAAELVKADDEGLCMVDFLHGCFVDWIHDPSVGFYGVTDGEAALANAIMNALTSAEVEVPLGGGKDG